MAPGWIARYARCAAQRAIAQMEESWGGRTVDDAVARAVKLMQRQDDIQMPRVGCATTEARGCFATDISVIKEAEMLLL